LRSVRGNIIYVDPNSLDSTDSIENTGTALTRPFKSIQRALIEAARFSYLPGPNNDRFGETTILVYPGDHLIDNRPGWIPDGEGTFRLRNGQISSDFTAFDLRTNFNVTTDNNALYKMNSIHGGVIVPRGTSIVGIDLRKTKIRPKYVPNPKNSNIERSAIFRLTGGCYLSQFSIFDSDINGQSFIDYTGNKYTPNFSHHKLTCFEYADGYNKIDINDDFQIYSTDRTDLDVYYEKLSLAYGPSAREILPDYPDDVDIETKIDEYRIVGSRGEEVGISSIFSGDGVTANKTITVFLESEVEGLAVDTPIRIDGAVVEGYDGQYIVKNVVSPTQIQFETTVIPTGPDGGTGGTLSIVSDTVTSASPYIFNCSLRSVYGMCGLHADGDSVEGFRSIVVAQFTGISLQKDNDAFVKYDPQSGKYLDSEDVPNIYSDSLGRYKPEYENYHIKASNNAFIQCVSIFAIGFAQQFEAASGGDQSITNSNSNFGAKALLSRGFRKDKFIRDDLGYITHIIPAKQNISDTINIEYLGYDAAKTVSVGSTTRLYLYNQTDESSPPEHIINGFRIGAKKDDVLYLPFSSGIYSAPIIMGENYQFAYEKSYKVAKQIDGITNSISSNIISLQTSHQLQDGESVRLISDTGELPDKVESNRVYYAITSGLSANQLKIASSFNDAISNNSVDIYSNEASNIKVVSRVSDKKSGDVGHPVQYDDVEGQWYITAKLPSAFLTALGLLNLDPESTTLSTGQRTYIQRLVDSRALEDKLYKIRYVIPKNTDVKSRTPLDGYIIQSSTSIPESDAEVSYQYGLSTVKTLDAENQLRSTRFISNASWDGTSATITTELPHRLSIGSQVDILNILSTSNVSGTYNSGYNGLYTVTQITSSRSFKYTLSSDPGTFLDNTSTRTRALPRFDRKQYDGTYFIYKSQELQEYVHQKQDGIYYLTVLSSSTTPNVDPFTNFKLSQPIKNLYPEIDRDNLNSDPDPTECFALPDPIGQVVVNNPEKSITKESINDILIENSVGFGVTYISTTSGFTHMIFTNIDHGLNPITSLTISNSGNAYGTISGSIQTLYNADLTGGSGEGASAVVKTNTSGSITEIEIMSGGSGYVVGDVLTVTGVATTTGHSPATVTVNSIYNHVGEILQISGVGEDYEQYNTLYRILSVDGSKKVTAESATNISHSSVSQEKLTNSNCHLTGGLHINGGGVNGGFQVYYNALVETDGIQTFLKVVLYNTQRPKQLKVGQKIILKTLANASREFVITGLARYANKDGFTIEAVDNTPNLAFLGSNPRTFPYGHYSSSYGNNTEDNENRVVTKYGGVMSTLTSTITNTTTTIGISNLSSLGLKIGDYLEINNEIVRISRSVSGSSIQAFRGLLGTQSRSHGTGSYVKKIIITPIEFRRNSILRASGHTFEYVGFGPGNYSNSLPERQDRQISEEEEIISQSLKIDGGVTVYTGMNNDGDFYIGNKIINSSTGNESVFDSPIPSLRGDKTDNKFNNIINTEKANITDSIKVEGGPDGTSISEFNSPVIFNNRLTSNSGFGIESNSIYIQGNETVSRKYTVTSSEPTIIGNVGDVEYYSRPEDGEFSGWIYTRNNAWRKYGPVQNADGAYEGTWNGTFEGTFYGDASGLTGLDSAWKRTSAGIHTSVNVGIGTEQASSIHKLEVNGSTNIKGVLNVGEIIERVTIDSSTELGNPLSPTTNINLGDNNVYYFTRSATQNWGINFRSSASQSLDQFMSVGQTLTVAIMTTQGANAYYNNTTSIDGAAITVFEYGDLEIIEGNPDGIDMYTYVIIKKSNTGSIPNKFTVLRSLSQYKQQ
jgi:hypothetical protein